MNNIAYQDHLYTVKKAKGKYSLYFGDEYLVTCDTFHYALHAMDLHKLNSLNVRGVVKASDFN